MKAMTVDFANEVAKPIPLELDLAGLDKGIDNYHVDVEISPQFLLQFEEAVEQILKRAIVGKALPQNNLPFLDNLRYAYTDLMTVALHRTRVDLAPEQMQVIQFAVIKYILCYVEEQLAERLNELKEASAKQQSAGSGRVLHTHERMVWLRKHQSRILYSVNQLIFKQLYREEVNNLRTLRQQYLGDAGVELVNVLFNPILQAESPDDADLLLDQYSMWPGEAAFQQLNVNLERIMGKNPEIPAVQALKSDQKVAAGQTEIYDEMGGLLAIQSYLGTAEDQHQHVGENVDWLGLPGNINLLFDSHGHDELQREVKSRDGFVAGLKASNKLRSLRKTRSDIKKLLKRTNTLEMSVAGSELKKFWAPSHAEVLDIKEACEWLADINRKKVQQKLGREETGAFVKLMEDAEEAVAERLKEDRETTLLKVLSDLSRYRLHLKYFRFAHRIFNRVRVLKADEDIHLSKKSKTLYQLLRVEEIEKDESKIIHHAILKADVRGSTTVTTELMQRDLNPASYFSLRFFNPINERLGIYGAGKVFIEGDAVILSLFEYNDRPQGWFAVSRACGLARDMIDIVNSKNSHSKRMNLPLLEIGIGICFSKDEPLFLYDDKKPIMISSAIGDADRLSSCSWKLRANFESGPFNIGVLEIKDARERGEKGHDYARYNVNGIAIDHAAFSKLKSEIRLTAHKINIGGRSVVLYVGKFPDMNGKMRDVVIREGAVGVWNGTSVEEEVTNGRFYEVVSNRKIISHVIGDKSYNESKAASS